MVVLVELCPCIIMIHTAYHIVWFVCSMCIPGVCNSVAPSSTLLILFEKGEFGFALIAPENQLKNLTWTLKKASKCQWITNFLSSKIESDPLLKMRATFSASQNEGWRPPNVHYTITIHSPTTAANTKIVDWFISGGVEVMRLNCVCGYSRCLLHENCFIVRICSFVRSLVRSFVLTWAWTAATA